MAPGRRLPRSPLGPPPDAAPVLAAAWAAIGFLIETGALLHFPDTSHGLRNLYFLDPIWLSECLQRIFSIRGSRSVAKNGVIRAEDLRVLLVGTGFTQQTEEQYFQFLAKFEIALPVANNRCVADRAAPGSTEPGPEGGGRACRGHGPTSERGEGGRARCTPGSQPEPARSLGPPMPRFSFRPLPGTDADPGQEPGSHIHRPFPCTDHRMCHPPAPRPWALGTSPLEPPGGSSVAPVQTAGGHLSLEPLLIFPLGLVSMGVSPKERETTKEFQIHTIPHARDALDFGP